MPKKEIGDIKHEATIDTLLEIAYEAFREGWKTGAVATVQMEDGEVSSDEEWDIDEDWNDSCIRGKLKHQEKYLQKQKRDKRNGKIQG